MCVHNGVMMSTDTTSFISLRREVWDEDQFVMWHGRVAVFAVVTFHLKKRVFPQRSRTRVLRSVRCGVVTHPCCFQVCELRQVAAVSWFQRFLCRFSGRRSLTWKLNPPVLFWDWYLRTALQKLWLDNELIRTAWSNGKVGVTKKQSEPKKQNQKNPPKLLYWP